MSQLADAILFTATWERERQFSHWYSRRKCMADFFPFRLLKWQSTQDRRADALNGGMA